MNMDSKAQRKMIFFSLQALPLKANLRVSSNKSEFILLSKINEPTARLLLLLSSFKYVKRENFD